jgi:hypothetical protein
VERALGQPLDTAPGPHFIVSTEQQGAGFAARLEITGGAKGAPGARTFGAATCEELIETVALAVAIAMGAAQEPASAVTPDASAETADRDAHLRSTQSALQSADEGADGAVPPPTRSAAPRIAAMAWGVGDSGSLPGPSLGIALGAGLEWTALELRVMGLLLPEQHADMTGTDTQSRGADIGLLAGSALACAPLKLEAGAVELGACAGWELGRLAATGTGVSRPHQKSTLWSAPRLDLGVRWAVPRSSLWLELVVSVAAPLIRDEFILKDIGSVYRPPNMIGRASLGVGWGSD